MDKTLAKIDNEIVYSHVWFQLWCVKSMENQRDPWTRKKLKQTKDQ